MCNVARAWMDAWPPRWSGKMVRCEYTTATRCGRAMRLPDRLSFWKPGALDKRGYDFCRQHDSGLVRDRPVTRQGVMTHPWSIARIRRDSSAVAFSNIGAQPPCFFQKIIFDRISSVMLVYSRFGNIEYAGLMVSYRAIVGSLSEAHSKFFGCKAYHGSGHLGSNTKAHRWRPWCQIAHPYFHLE